MQEAVAAKIHSSEDVSALFDEQSLFEDLGAYLQKKGLNAQAVDEAIVNLMIKTVGVEEVGDHKKADVEMDETIPDGEAAENYDRKGLTSDEEVEKVGEVSPHDKVIVDELLGQHVVSISGSTRCLHRVGDCHRRPGKDYMVFETLVLVLRK